jgi:type IV secretory system conjugative DNA transfer VirD4/TraG family protein
MNRLFIGFDARGAKIRLSPEERKAHMHVIGSTRSGKSKFLEWMMRGDLRNGQGFCLIDPHGTLYDALVRFAAHRVERGEIILLNLAEPDPIIGFNPFQRLHRGEVSVQVDRRIASTLRAWGVRTGDETPTLERTLRLVYTTVIEKGLGLTQARHLIDFDAREIRAHLIENFESELIENEWRELQDLKRKEWRDEVLSAKNRLCRLLTSNVLARFMGLPGRSIDLASIIEEGKVLLVNLAATDSFSRENARVFGALLVNEFFEVASRRKPDQAGNDPAPYFLYIDEFQNFVSIDLTDMLDQVSKRGLFAVLAHQRFLQLDEDVIDAALSNCHIKAVFGGLTFPSARRMAEELAIVDPLKVKVAIYQTKFWPKYARDTVYARGHGRAASHDSGFNAASSHSASQFFNGTDWFPAEGLSSMHGSSERSAEASSEMESEADIPIFVPVPFRELSSVQHYTPEEQIIQFATALKHQFQRHCFIKIHHHDAQPMLVPFVEEFQMPSHNHSWYVRKLFADQKALRAAEIDTLLAERDVALEELALTSDKPATFWEKKRAK